MVSGSMGEQCFNFFQDFRKWLAAQNILAHIDEDNEIFESTIQLELDLANRISAHKAASGIEWDIQLYCRATNGLSEMSNHKYQKLHEQMIYLFYHAPAV